MAASQGDKYSYRELGQMHQEGLINGTPNYQEASKYYHIAADLGLTSAQDNLARLYYTAKLSQDMQYNYQQAHKWWLMAANSDEPFINFNIATFYEDKETPYCNYTLALKYFTVAANSDYRNSKSKVLFYQELPTKINIALLSYIDLGRNEGVSYVFFSNFLLSLYTTLGNLQCDDDLIRPIISQSLTQYFITLNPNFNDKIIKEWYTSFYG